MLVSFSFQKLMTIVEERVDAAVLRRHSSLNVNKDVLFEGHFYLSEKGDIYNKNIMYILLHFNQPYYFTFTVTCLL